MTVMPEGFDSWSTDAQLAYKLGRATAPPPNRGIASTLVRQSDDSMATRVATALSFARYFALVDGDFDLDQFVEDCFAADVASDGAFRVEADPNLLYFVQGREGLLVAADLADDEAAAFDKLRDLEVTS